MRFPSLLLCALVAGSSALLSASCGDTTKLRALCNSDVECIEKHDGNENWACDARVGDCVCTGDAACQAREHCETRPGGDGRCHPDRTCDWNSDCEEGFFCDTENKICRLTGCEIDRQCDLGNVCDRTTRTCVPGCRSSGDCATLGDACLCEDANGEPVPCVCDETTELGRATCPTGVCTSDTCADDTFCKYGERCVATESGGSLKRCVKDLRGPFCDACEFSPGGANRCGDDPGNFCLVDSTQPGASFCGVNCMGDPGSEDTVCPNGFSCRDVLVLTGTSCSSQNACSPYPSAPTCTVETVDEDCPPGSQCIVEEGETVGQCAGTCRVGEGSVTGFCTCVTDDECPQQTCSQGICTYSGRRCNDDDECRTGDGAIVCQNDGNIGYCFIGRNCAPDEGITCRDVRSGEGPLGR